MFRPRMIFFGLLLGACHLAIQHVESSRVFEEHAEVPPLFMTPLIKAEMYSKAKESAKTSLLNITSYSGFVTVNENLDINLFIWYIPALEEDPELAPTIVWLDGGPGVSSMYGLLLGLGPYSVKNGSIELRKRSWNQHHNMLYIDNPVGTGYSFTSQLGYRRDEKSLCEDLYEALSQLAKLFPEIETTPLYIGGESYGGKFAPSLGSEIFEKGGFNLHGLIIGNGFMDPISQIKYTDYLYATGLISFEDRSDFDSIIHSATYALGREDYSEGTRYLAELMIDFRNLTAATLFRRVTGFQEYFSLLGDVGIGDLDGLFKFVQSPSFRNHLHVGDTAFGEGEIVRYFLEDDLTRSVLGNINDLLTNGVRVLLYNGQLDIVCPHSLIDSMFDSQMLTSFRKLWYFNGTLAGYWQDYYNLAAVLVRNAGHVAFIEQPGRVLNAVEHFTGIAKADLRPTQR